MNLLSKKIALFFVRKNRISAEEIDLYAYCFEMALSAILNFSIIILGAIVTGRYIECLLFSAFFIITRKLIGGFHATTSFGCTGLLIITFSLFLSMLNSLAANVLVHISFGFSAIQFFPIALLAPAIHPNNPVSKDNIKIMRKMATLLSLLILILDIFNLLFISQFLYRILHNLSHFYSCSFYVCGENAI